MKAQLEMPQQLEGKWIWLKDKSPEDCTCQLFRGDFTLSEMPASTEIWISAKTIFHLYVNGRLAFIGPLANPTEKSYLSCIDINYLVQVGNNRLGIKVFNANIPLAAYPQKPGGLWVQVICDGKTTICTDENWRCMLTDCYASTGICHHIGGSFLENLDFTKHPHDWYNAVLSFPTKGSVVKMSERLINTTSRRVWTAPTQVKPVDAGPNGLEIPMAADNIIETINWEKILASGEAKQKRQAHWVDFRSLSSFTDGIYCAQTFVYSAAGGKHSINCYCDRPYRLFLNGELLKEQAVEIPPVSGIVASRGSRRLAVLEYTTNDVDLTLQPGWNRFLLIEDCATCDGGLSLIWTDTEAGSLPGRIMPEESAPEGWDRFGPLRLPLASVHPSIKFPAESTPFMTQENPPADVSVLLSAYDFVQSKRIRDLSKEAEVSFKNNRFLIYDFGRSMQGFPKITLQGEAGDVVYVVCGEQIDGCEVLGYHGGYRRVTCLTLSGDHDTWLPGYPQGFRYVMLIGKEVRSKVLVEEVCSQVISHNAMIHGHFSCSDKRLNQIWETGRATLNGTIRGYFIDSPCHDQAQYIADAMIQSWAAYHLNGDFDMAGGALAAFAKTQYETGALNAVSPSGLFQVLPDYSLLWVVWLHRHYLYTGDNKLLAALFPTMVKLLEYYNELAIRNDGPLGDLSSFLGIYCFLDYDNDIDRLGISTGLNAIYSRALLCGSWLAEQTGEQEMADKWKKRADNLVREIRDLTYDEESGLFADSYHNGEVSESCSAQTNILAIYGGLALPEDYDRIWNQIFQDFIPYEPCVAPEYDNPYFKYFVLEVAFALGRGEWAVKLIKYYWGGMLDAGATTWWELFSPSSPKLAQRMVSKCHGCATSPNGFLISEIAGIRPLLPGLKRIHFNPLLTSTTWVKAQVPSVHGRINVEWRLREEDHILEVNLSANYPVEVLCTIDASIANDAEISISDEITLLEEEL